MRKCHKMPWQESRAEVEGTGSAGINNGHLEVDQSVPAQYTVLCKALRVLPNSYVSGKIGLLLFSPSSDWVIIEHG
jgi:hypothetical protein